MAVNADDRLIAAAQHIVKSLGTSKNVTDDMISILSNFDNRFSTITDLLSSTSLSSDDFHSLAVSRLDAAEKLILRWDSPSAGFLRWDENPDEASEYLAEVDEVVRMTEEERLEGEALDRAETVLQIAMAKLEDEFRHVMVRNTVPLDADRIHSSIRRFSLSFSLDCGEGFESPKVGDERGKDDPEGSGSGSGSRERERSRGFSLSEDLSMDLVRPEAVEDLRQIADRMIRSRYEKECCQVYSSVRREVLDECLSVLGVDRLSIEEVQRMEWGALDDKMKKWNQSVKVVVRVILFGEKQLCDRIFGDSEVIKEVCFAETAKGCVIQLLNFGEAVAIGQRSSEKLFRILNMYIALADVIPDLQSLFPEDCRDSICGEAENVLSGLGDAARGTLVEFENKVKGDPSRKPTQAGEIHPLTRYVMNYVKLIADYSSSFNSLLSESEDGDHNDDPQGEEDSDKYTGSMSPLCNRLRLLISCLESNLEAKSKSYDDVGLQYVFLMNNILYIVQKVRDSELGTLLGDHWIRKHRGQIHQYATSYLRASWTKLLSCLKDDGTSGGGGSGRNVSKVAIKERFKNFNLAYEEIYRTQSAWKVPDPQLRDELRVSISEKVIPAYRAFMGRYASQIEGGRHASKFIKFTPDDLENHLADLFEGTPGSFNQRRKLSS